MNVIRVSIDFVEPGTTLGRPIYDGRGGILLGRGVVLTEAYIQRLCQLGINTVYVDGPFEQVVDYENAISDATYIEVMKQTKQISKMLVSPGKDIDLSDARKCVENVVDEIIRNRTALLDVSALHDMNEDIFSHSISVCALSVIVGLERGMMKSELYLLGMGAMLHDLGKIMLNDELLDKKEPLTNEEWEQIREHANLGFEMLRKKTNLLVAHVSLQHQERYNGSGYPRGLKGNEIHPFARIVGVADAYDALTSNKPYRPAWAGHKAYEYIVLNSGTLFDPEVVRLFCGSVAIYPNSSLVQLSNGQKALVVKQNAGFPLRPMVYTVADNRIDRQIDLMDDQHAGLFVLG